MRLRELEPGRQSVPMRFSFILLRRRQQTRLLATIRHIGIRRHFHPPNRYDAPPPGWMKKTANISLTQTHCTSAADDMSLDLGLTAGAVTHRIDEYTFIQERVKFFVYGSLVGLLLLGVDSVGVGEGELGEGLFPVGGDLAFDEAAVG